MRQVASARLLNLHPPKQYGQWAGQAEHGRLRVDGNAAATSVTVELEDPWRTQSPEQSISNAANVSVTGSPVVDSSVHV